MTCLSRILAPLAASNQRKNNVERERVRLSLNIQLDESESVCKNGMNFHISRTDANAERRASAFHKGHCLVALEKIHLLQSQTHSPRAPLLCAIWLKLGPFPCGINRPSLTSPSPHFYSPTDLPLFQSKASQLTNKRK